MRRYVNAVALLLAPVTAKNDNHSFLKAFRKLYHDSTIEDDVCTCEGDTQILMNELNRPGKTSVS